MVLQEVGLGDMGWIELAQDRDRWRSLVNVVMSLQVLDFKLSPCFESCMYSFWYFPGVRLWFADVSEPSISSIFKGWM